MSEYITVNEQMVWKHPPSQTIKGLTWRDAYFELHKEKNEHIQQLEQIIKYKNELMDKVIKMEKFTFAECEDAEFIIDTIKQAREGKQ